MQVHIILDAVMLVSMSVLQLKGPNLTPFSAEKENLILGLWQLQQAGQDFRIKQVCFVMLICSRHVFVALSLL